MPRFASAQCKDGTLVVAEIGKAPRNFMSRLLDYALGAGNYHPIEYQMFFAAIRHNAHTRVAAYLKSHTDSPGREVGQGADASDPHSRPQPGARPP
jgi:hypothetical protein